MKRCSIALTIREIRSVLESDFEKRFPALEKLAGFPLVAGFPPLLTFEVFSFSKPEKTGWVSPWENAK